MGQAGRADEAVALFQSLLEDQNRVLGADHPDTLMTRSCLASTLGEAGRADEAIERLLVAEARAAVHEHLPLLMRVRRSLRLAGVRRTVPRTAAGQLTGREAEVLELVADGLTNDEIARRLGIGRPTVVRLIKSAQQKLGASSRTQAAALAAEG